MNFCDTYSGSPCVAEGLPPSLTNHTESNCTPLHILVVDDDPGVRNILASILRRADHEVMCACDGEEGWEALCSGSYDGMITDHDMPRLSGLDLIRRVRAVPSNIPIILVSGQMPREEMDFTELVSPGMALEKPFSFREVFEVVNRAFFKRAGARPVPRRHYNARLQVPSVVGAYFNDPL
jgi:DNA-binding response OmpR family regulator